MRKILIDTREKHPWKFSKRDWIHGCLSMALKTGDYSLEGLQNIFTIDKKGKVSELAANLLQERFDRELQRMEEIKHSYIICDFPQSLLLAYPKIDEIPYFIQKKIRARGPFLVKILEELKVKYKTEWIFTEKGEARKEALELIKYMDSLYVE